MRTQLATLAIASALLLHSDFAPPMSAAQNAQKTPALKPNEIAVIGCLQREADYRAVHDKGRGGILGTGIGTKDEYVLVEATPVQQAPSPSTAVKTPTRAYLLNGKLEDSLVTDIGRTVQVVGVVEKATDEGELPRLTISLAHAVGDFCPARK